MTEAEFMLNEKIHKQSEAVNRFMSAIKTYELDMDFTPTTDLEMCLKDTLQDMFKLAHKMQQEINNTI